MNSLAKLGKLEDQNRRLTMSEFTISGRKQTIFRTEHDKSNPYITLNRLGIDDETLSFKARGILIWMLARPQGWKYSLTDMANNRSDNNKTWSIKSGLKELYDAGYLYKECYRDSLGRTDHWETIVFETPELCDKYKMIHNIAGLRKQTKSSEFVIDTNGQSATELFNG